MTFRDSYCSASKLCATTDCPRHFGDEARRAARAWWGGDEATVAFMDWKNPHDGYEGCGRFVAVGEERQP